MKELLMLKLHNLILDKRAVICHMEHDIARFGEWKTDYHTWINDISVLIEKTADEIIKEGR